MKTKILICLSFVSNTLIGQQPTNWITTGNSSFSTSSPYIGTNSNVPFRIFTNGVHRASFTWDGTEYADGSSGSCNGIRLFNQANPQNTIGVLDLLTSQQNKTHISFGRNGSVTGAGTGDRMEYYAHGLGFWFNAVGTQARSIWTRGGVENARMGINSYWRFGANSTNIDANRRVEIVDGNPQLRLTNSNNYYTDFQTNSVGNLQIMPQVGRVGINLSSDPTANLDINGNTRIRNVQAAIPNSILVGVNATGTSDVNVRRLDFTGDATQVLLGNGTWGSATAGGAVCGSNFTIGRLTANTRLNLSNNNYYFNNETTPVNTTYNRVAVGYNCTNTLPAKFNVMQKEATSISFNSTASHAQIQDIGTNMGQYFVGHRGLANGVQTVLRITNNGGYFTAANAAINYGVRGEAFNGFYTSGPSLNYGGYFTAEGNSSSYGVRTSAVNLTSNGISYGIYASASGGATTRAGYFEGIVEAESYTQYSDSIFKINVTKLSGSLQLLQALKPVSYMMDASNYPQMNFDNHLQFGYIAQDVEDVFPNLVYDSYRPSGLDSLGNPVDSAVTYKSLNYNGFISLNTQAIIELKGIVENRDSIIDSLTNQISNLNNRLTQLENCLSTLLPTLCQMNQNAIQSNTPQSQEAIRSELSVRLSNKEAIILDQNVPNPFAEQTVINFSIPASVKKAQIHFYDGQGKLMQSVDVIERGLGSLTVFGADLSSGVYTYTLVADGQIVATKKMMKQ